ncbi:MAG: helix-turn-helix transcriptional regulator [Ktedonobacteraceae bacterium]|nr:helix-turn-helix transcriptional regulator [Ktedonobacteraceae bacterium]MBA3826795.1 helix-turn-helix transcriptional regulator [Ktedonobacterales bacterium]
MTLKMLRESHLMTQAALAQKVGVQVTTVSNWERGEQRPQLSIMSRLAEIFGLTPQEIIAILDETMAKK